MIQKLYVQFGSHWDSPPGWLNFDASPTLRLERIPLIGKLVKKNTQRFPISVRYGDIVKGLPVADNSCQGVYCSHVLEHLSLDDCRKALENTHRILKKGGIFRMVLPDLEYYINQYIKDRSAERATTFMQKTGLGQQKRPKRIVEMVSDIFGNSMHRWMWDFDSLSQELRRCNFNTIKRVKFGDSFDRSFREVEKIDRWKNCLGIECKKN